MRKAILLLAAALSIVAAQASASDMYLPPLKHKTYYTPLPNNNWNGLYVGVNGAYGWGSNAQNIVGANANGNTALSSGYVPGTLGMSNSGGIFGGTVGYNWQYGNFVFGPELEFDWANVKGSSASTATQGPASLTTSGNSRLDWLGTARARLGYLVTPTTLLYGVGGAALGGVNESTTATLTGAAPFNGTATINQNSTNWGWTVGAGLEQQLTGNWSAKIEYDYVDLGSTGGPFGTVLGTGKAAIPVGFVVSQPFKDQMVKVGVNYRF